MIEFTICCRLSDDLGLALFCSINDISLWFQIKKEVLNKIFSLLTKHTIQFTILHNSTAVFVLKDALSVWTTLEKDLLYGYSSVV